LTSDAPRVAPKILDWFHLGMKLHAVKTPIFARTYYRIDLPLFMARCERLWKNSPYVQNVAQLHGQILQQWSV
jgi:hypothetical protein